MQNDHREYEGDSICDTIVAGVIFIVVMALFLMGVYYTGKLAIDGIGYAESRRATAECEKWADEAKVFPAYFLVPWQKEQCDTYGVAVDAPVRDYSNN